MLEIRLFHDPVVKDLIGTPMRALMQSEKVHLTKEKETLLVTLYLRALDSRSKNLILHDKAAEDAVSRIDDDFRNWCGAVCRIAVSTIRNRRARATCATSSKLPSFA